MCVKFRHSYYAVCLDGSPPAYHMDKGFGAGINNWLVHIEVLDNCLKFCFMMYIVIGC